MKFCEIDVKKICNDCKDCELCDLVPGKICDNCGKCLGLDAEVKIITVNDLVDKLDKVPDIKEEKKTPKNQISKVEEKKTPKKQTSKEVAKKAPKKYTLKVNYDLDEDVEDVNQ